MKRYRVNRLLSSFLLLLITVVISIVYISIRQSERIRLNAKAVSHTMEVMNMATAVELSSQHYVLAVRDNLLTRDTLFSRIIQEQTIRITGLMDSLRRIESNDIDQPLMIDTLRYYVDQLLQKHRIADRIVFSNVPPGSKDQALTAVKASMRADLFQISRFSNTLKEQEHGEREEKRRAGENFLYRIKIILYVMLVLVLLITGLLVYRIRKEFTRQWASEQKFITLLEAAPDATIISDTRGVIEMANRQAEKLFGYSNQELRGMQVERLMPEQFRKQHVALRTGFAGQSSERSMDNGKVLYAVRKDGTEVAVEISLAPIETKEGKFIAAAIRDVSARIKSEEELRQLYTQVNLANEALYFTDPNLIIKTWNRGAEVLYGYTAAEAVGRHSVELLKTEFSDEQYAAARLSMNKDDHWSGDIRRFKKSGKDIYVHSSLSAIRNDKGEVTGYFSVSFDISAETKLRNEVKYLANLAEQMSEAVISRKPGDRKMLTWNSGAEKLFGYTKEEALGKTINELGIASYGPNEMNKVEASLLATGVWKSENDFIRKDGTVFAGSVSASIILDELDEPSFVFLIKDVSREKELADVLKKNNEELEQKVQARTREIGQRETEYRYLFENNPLPMWVFDLDDFRFMDVNEMAIRKYGYTREEFLKLTLTDIRPEADRERFRHFDHAWKMSTQDTNRGVWRHCKKNGEIIDVEVIAHSIVFQGKKARLVLLNDVTQRLKTEKELQASEKKFRALIENSNDIIALLDTNNNITYRSPSAIRITGWTDEEMLKKNFLEEIVHPDDRERLREVFSDVLLSPGVPVVVYYRSLHKDGRYIDVEGVLINLLHRDYVRAMVINLRDVTEQRKADQLLVAREKRFRSLIENSFDIILLLDEQFRVTYRSPSAERISGRSDADVMGLDPRDFIHPDDLPVINKGILKLMDTPGGSEHALFRYMDSTHGYLWMEGYATNLLQDENVRSIVFNYRDVTARIEAEERLVNREKHFRSLIENSMDVIMVLDASFTMVYRSPSGIKVTGLADDVTIGRDGRYFIHPEDLGTVNILLKELLRMPGRFLNLLFRYRCADGHYIWVEGSATNLLEEDNIRGLVFNLRDVTERIKNEEKIRASEERYRETLDNMIEGVQIIGFDRKYKYVNTAVAAQAHTTKDDLIGSTMVKCFPGIEHTEVYKLIVRCLEERIPFRKENHFVLPDGDELWVQLSIQPVLEGVFILSVDITDRIKAATALKEEQQKLESIAVSSPGMIYSFQLKPDGSMSFPYASNAMEEIFGYGHEFINKDISGLLNNTIQEDRELFVERMMQSAKDLSPWNLEFRFMHPLKGLIWIEGNSIPTRDADGTITWHGVVMDVTERKNAENLIRENEERYRTLVEQAFDGILFYDARGRIMDCNNSGAITIGYSREELIGMNVKDLFFKQDLYSRPLDIPQVGTGAQVFDFRTMRRKDGTAVEIELVTRILPDGRYLAVGRDITEQNVALSQQNLLSSIVNTTDDAILSTDVNGRITSWNKGAEHIYGYTSDEMIGRNHQELLPDDKNEEEMAIMKRIYGGEFLQHYETKRKRKDGTLIQVSITTSPLLNKNGKLTGISKVIRDITRQKNAEEQLKKIASDNQQLYDRLSVILNTLPASVALLDPKGVMVEVNDAWKNFADVNGFSGERYGIGNSYLTVSTQSFGDNEQIGKDISVGIQEVLNGTSNQFEYEYPWHLPKLNRWFRIVATPLKGHEFNGAVVMHIDISEIRRLEQERIESRIEEQKKVTEAMLKGQEKERNAIGIELHDNVNQILVGTKVLLSVVRDFPEKTAELIPSCIDNISLAVQENRKIAHELVTPNLSDENLLQQITRLSQTMLKNAGINTYINHESLNESLLPDEMKLALYRVAQEQCTNIIKYAEAEQVIISLATKRDNFFMRIADDGHGTDPKKVTHGIGLKNISSRLGVFGGTISIDTAPGQGFALEIEIPLKQVKTTNPKD